MLTKLERLNQMYDFLVGKGYISTKKDLSAALGAQQQASLSRAFSGNERYLTDSLLSRINATFSNIFSKEWLKTGEGDMLCGSEERTLQNIIESNTIPYNNMGVASVINVNGMFPTATSAIALVDDAMDIYPRGSIIVLREVKNTALIQFGKEYFIETSEFSIIRCVQDGGDCFNCYGYSTSTFPDGELMFPMISIPKSEVTKMHKVIGVIIKY